MVRPRLVGSTRKRESAQRAAPPEDAIAARLEPRAPAREAGDRLGHDPRAVRAPRGREDLARPAPRDRDDVRAAPVEADGVRRRRGPDPGQEGRAHGDGGRREVDHVAARDGPDGEAAVAIVRAGEGGEVDEEALPRRIEAVVLALRELGPRLTSSPRRRTTVTPCPSTDATASSPPPGDHSRPRADHRGW